MRVLTVSIIAAIAAAGTPAKAADMSRETLLDCHSDVSAILADLIIDRDKYGLDNPEALAEFERQHKLFTAFALVSGNADPNDDGKAYLDEMFARGEEKYKVYDGRMAGDRKAEFVQAFVARNTECQNSMRADPDFELIPRHLTE